MSKTEPAHTATDAPAQPPAVGALLERGVGRLAPERAAFAAWVEPGRYEKDTHQMAWLVWQRWEAALRQTWQMVDPLKPAGQPGSYWRGQDAGIAAALTTLRANLKTPNVEAKRALPEKD